MYSVQKCYCLCIHALSASGCVVWCAVDLGICHVRHRPPVETALLLMQGPCTEKKRGGFMGFLKALFRPCLGRSS